MPILVGITGNIGCGKSLVGSLLNDHGIPIIDSDHITHELYESDKQVKDEILKEFGTLERKEIGKVVFSDPQKKKILESIIHPRVSEMLGDWVRKHSDKDVLVNLVPLLFEAKLEDRFDLIVTVITEEKTQIERIRHRNPELKNDEILKRIKTQMPQEEKKSRSDFFIDNSGSMEETMKQVDKLVKSLAKYVEEKSSKA